MYLALLVSRRGSKGRFHHADAAGQARDEDGNKRLSGGDDFVVEIRGGPVAVFGAVADRSDGTYVVTYRVDRAGECLIHVTTGVFVPGAL